MKAAARPARAHAHPPHPRHLVVPMRAGADADVLPPIGPPSDAGGDWPIDHAAARRYADATLAGLDWSKHVVVLWVPGTSNPAKDEHPTVSPVFGNSFYRTWTDGSASLALMRYEGSWNLRASMATGVEALRYVLRDIHRRAPGIQVLLAGESQGAWVIGEALQDPEAHAAVTRTAIWGHPSVATHHFSDGHDTTVREFNHPLDHVAIPISGNKAAAMEGLIVLESALSLDKVPTLAKALLDQPVAGTLALVNFIRGKLPAPLKVMIPDYHNYDDDFLKGAEFLKDGVRR